MNPEVLKQIQPTDKVTVVWAAQDNKAATADDTMQSLMESLKSAVSAGGGSIQLENLDIFTGNTAAKAGSLILTGWPEAYPAGKHDFNLFSSFVAKMPSGGRLIAREAVDGDLAKSVERIRKAAVLSGLVNIKFVRSNVLIKFT